MDGLWIPDQGDGTYKNPIIFADYSDPDVIRVGDCYYMTASSFNYIPGLPILISYDLVNWELVNYALRQIPYETYNIPQHSKGVWAPAFRYYDGWFMIYYGMPDEGIFMVKTKDPLKEWEPPIMVLQGKGLIDPCPFWEEDGRAYVIHGYAKSRIGFKSVLGIFPMSRDGSKAIGEDHILYNGIESQPTIEGPKVYKKGDYYYILAPAGGVKNGWQTALRAKNILGPYEEKVVMKQGGKPVNGPHQGGLVEAPDGREWFLHFQDRGLYGRIVHLQPVTWYEGWPIIGVDAENGCGEPCLEFEMPGNSRKEKRRLSLQASDDFSGERLALQWQWLGNARSDFYDLTGKSLLLYAKNPSGESIPTLWKSANVLTQKLICPQFLAMVSVDYENLCEGEQAGMVMMGGDYAYLSVRQLGMEKKLVLGESYVVLDERTGNNQVKERQSVLCELPKGSRKVDFSMQLEWLPDKECPKYAMFYRMDGTGDWRQVATDFVPSDHTWVGAKLGLFASACSDKEMGGYAEFTNFVVVPLVR